MLSVQKFKFGAGNPSVLSDKPDRGGSNALDRNQGYNLINICD